MYTTSRIAFLTFCLISLMALGACSGSGSPVTANPNDPSNYSSSITGNIYRDSAAVTSGRVFVYNLENYSLFSEGEISNGKYTVGVDAGQYLVIPVSPSAWRKPVLTENFSNYVNISDGNRYQMDIELTSAIPSGESVVFGFVTSSENKMPIIGAVVEAAGKSTTTDGYGFYSMTVPSDTANFHISAQGFMEQNVDIRNAQVSASYFKTPFFNLNPTNKVGGSLGGTVRDISDGTGLGGVRITLNRPEDPNFTPVQFMTNLGGKYRFFNLPEGIYKMLFERPGYVSGTRDGLVLKDKDEAIVNVFMQADASDRASVSGFVRNAGVPLPVANARVSLSNPLLGSKTTTTGPTGYYNIPDVVVGDYTITIVAPGVGVTFYESASTFQTIFPGENKFDFTLRFLEEGVLRGTVSLSTGGGGAFAFPPTGVLVTAEKVGGPLTGVKWQTNTDGKGQFAFNGIPAGFYLVQGSITFSSTESFYGSMSGVSVTAGTTTNIDLQLSPI